MISASQLRFQDRQFEYSTGTGRWRWTTRADLSGLGPVYSVRDIVTPFGMLRDSIPLPGDVVQAMGESITLLKTSFPPAILIGPPTSLTITVDEGRGFSPPENVALTNSGVLGTLLNVSLGSNAGYCQVSPSNVGNLASGEAGGFRVEVDSTDLVASSSPYSATVTATDPTASNNPRTLPVSIVVRPKATITRTPVTLTFMVERPLSGAFPSINPQTFAVQNTGPSGSVLDFQVQKLTNLSDRWFPGFSPLSALLTASASQNITVTVAPESGMLPGTYSETLRISGYSTNSFVDVLVQLIITP